MLRHPRVPGGTQLHGGAGHGLPLAEAMPAMQVRIGPEDLPQGLRREVRGCVPVEEFGKVLQGRGDLERELQDVRVREGGAQVHDGLLRCPQLPH